MPLMEEEAVLAEEVIMEILSRVPVKSLVQFRCVCKSWKSLISHPYFIKLHLHRSPNLIFLVFTSVILPKGQPLFIIYPASCFIHNPSSTIVAAVHDESNPNYLTNCNVLSSCNGLVCLLHHDIYEDHYVNYCVQFWNPAMRLTSEKSPCLSVEIGLRIDNYTCFGFGYDKSSDAYKLVALINSSHEEKDSEKNQVKVYTTGSPCWRDIQRFPAFPCRKGGIFLSGTLNWIAFLKFEFGPPHNKWNIHVNIDQFVIVSLDMEKETYKQLSLPPFGLDEIPPEGKFKPTIKVFGDCLCLFYDNDVTHFAMWQMKEFGVEKSWTQLVKVSYQHLQTGGPNPQLSIKPLCISENGDVMMLLKDSLEVILYNRRDNRVEGAAKICNNRVCMETMNYVESLTLPC